MWHVPLSVKSVGRVALEHLSSITRKPLLRLLGPPRFILNRCFGAKLAQIVKENDGPAVGTLMT